MCVRACALQNILIAHHGCVWFLFSCVKSAGERAREGLEVGGDEPPRLRRDSPGLWLGIQRGLYRGRSHVRQPRTREVNLKKMGEEFRAIAPAKQSDTTAKSLYFVPHLLEAGEQECVFLLPVCPLFSKPQPDRPTTRYPDAPIFAIGYSLGANLLVKYLGEEGRNGYRPLAGAVSVSNPWNFENNTVGGGKAKGLVAAAMGKIYSLALTMGLKVGVGVGFCWGIYWVNENKYFEVVLFRACLRFRSEFQAARVVVKNRLFASHCSCCPCCLYLYFEVLSLFVLLRVHCWHQRPKTD